MATIVLQYAGAALGTLVGGPIGGIIGRAAGAIAGNLIDQKLFGGGNRHIEGPRLNDLRVQASEEGAPIPDVYGRMRIAGQVIWATNLEEVTETSTEKSSSKGGPKTKSTEYNYFGNFAVSLCEGEVDYVGRVWADGREIDLAAFTHRFYRGSATQLPDSLITTVEGPDRTPAYRDLAYIVFERMPLAKFGNRIPQLAFEVYRHGNGAAAKIRALTIIPGSTEFGYARLPVTRETSPGVTVSENAHASAVRSDWDVSMDEMTGLCRNLDAVSLVVAWFGNDLRCGSCDIRPGVESSVKATSPDIWSVNGVARNAAHVVSQVDGGPAFGGTPSDASVVAAIQDLRARGLKIVFYPFLLMDVPASNGLPDPYGGTEQPIYPWRGRITANKAPGIAGTPDKTTAAATQIASFVGTATAGNYQVNGTTVQYSGPAEWSYRRMILHYAKLCAAAGGVDAFLIGSELRGLTTLRSSPSAFPFVTALQALAGDVKAILASADVSYAADWTEYFGYQPQDASQDVYFHLDPLWASPNISFIGIDNYVPLSDWRDGRSHADFSQTHPSIYNLDYLKSNVAGGEGYDWFYQTQANRDAQIRTPIVDGAYGKPWVYRFKDVKSWWLNQHFNRPGGTESSTATAWLPQSKPIWFTEAGCPAVDKGTNSPNLFYDAKSSESALPPYSGGQRDDLIQNRYVLAIQDYWNASGTNNPVSSVYGQKMVDAARVFYWTWDARPFPAFPTLADVWSDGPNYEKGHWLTGRLSSVDLGDLIKSIALKFGFTAVDVTAVEGIVDGYLIDRPMSARAALEDLLRAFCVDVFESEGKLKFVSRKVAAEITVLDTDLVDQSADTPLLSVKRVQETDLPQTVNVFYAESGVGYRTASVSQSRLATSSKSELTISMAACVNQSLAQARADIVLEEQWSMRETAQLALTAKHGFVESGDILRLSDNRQWRVTAVNDGEARRMSLVQYTPEVYEAPPASGRLVAGAEIAVHGKPAFVLMDLAVVTETSTNAPWAAAFAKPWPGSLALFRRTSDTSFAFNRTLEARATMGTTLNALHIGLSYRLDFNHTLEVELAYGALASISAARLLDGENIALIGTPASGFEIFQFKSAELFGPMRYRLRGLLRGLAGSAEEMLVNRTAGQQFILFNKAVVQPVLANAQQGLSQTWRIGPSTRDVADGAYNEATFDPELLPLRPLPPTQLRIKRDSAGVVISWIRQTRIDGDSWELNDVPLAETNESYELNIMDGATTRRTISLAQQNYLYSTADMITDFGAVPSTFDIRVAQVSQAFGPGTFAQRIINV